MGHKYVGSVCLWSLVSVPDSESYAAGYSSFAPVSLVDAKL